MHTQHIIKRTLTFYIRIIEPIYKKYPRDIINSHTYAKGSYFDSCGKKGNKKAISIFGEETVVVCVCVCLLFLVSLYMDPRRFLGLGDPPAFLGLGDPPALCCK